MEVLGKKISKQAVEYILIGHTCYVLKSHDMDPCALFQDCGQHFPVGNSNKHVVIQKPDMDLF